MGDVTQLFEVSWEVCNKVGGINTVLRSKAAKMVEIYGEGFTLIGPYFAKQASEFEELVPSSEYKSIFDDLRSEGVHCRYGKWLIPGEPRTILIDFPKDSGKINQLKKWLWDSYKIDSLRAGYDYDEPVVWGHYVGLLLEKIMEQSSVAHFHEWLAGVALLHLKQAGIKGLVFTTHATTLARTLAGNDVDFYSILDTIDVKEEIYRWQIESKHQLEAAAARECDIMTTVSAITGIECEHFLGRKPDILLPNGLDMDKFPTFEEASIEHQKKREKLKEFLFYYFFPYETFDIENLLFYFTAARYEFKGKGIDVYVKALGKLNEKLKAENSSKTIVSFVFVPGAVRGINSDIIENRTFFKDIQGLMDDKIDGIKNRLTYLSVTKNKVTASALFSEATAQELKKKVARLHREGSAPLCTHDLCDDNDSIIQGFRDAGLNNTPEDRVKVVFYPIYLTGADGLLNLSYYDALQGSHLGVFSSFYEPWGYTPMETSALGVPSVTGDLVGFGQYLKNTGNDQKGIQVLDRFGVSDADHVENLTDVMYEYSQLSLQDRITRKMEARSLAAQCDWKNFIQYYVEAHHKALE